MPPASAVKLTSHKSRNKKCAVSRYKGSWKFSKYCFRLVLQFVSVTLLLLMTTVKRLGFYVILQEYHRA